MEQQDTMQMEVAAEKPLPKPQIQPTKPDQKLLELLTEAIHSEKKDLLFYDQLIAKAKSKENKDIVWAVKMNTLKSIKLLQQIYANITGQKYAERDVTAEDFKSATFGDMATEAMFRKLNDVELYRKLYFAFLNLEIRDMLFEIITDKQNDAVKLLYVKN